MLLYNKKELILDDLIVKGITAHQMFRQDKYDMGVAWPWEKMIAKCGLQEVEL